MAILYGTTGEGETLPVLVDQFGNLLAKGIEGEPGPPGPPGVGQLPPDPYEGAILGWEDGELAWLGGSVPLPAGTYGPYTYIDGDERLDIPQDASSLVNGQQLYMSDFYGDEISVEFSTDTIASVAGNVLTFPTANNFDKFEVGDLVQTGLQQLEWSSYVTGSAYDSSYKKEYGFNGDLTNRAGGGLTFTPPNPIACTKVRIYMSTFSAPADTIFLNGVDIASEIPITSELYVPLEFTPTSNLFISYQCGSQGTGEPGWYAKIELLIDGNWIALIDESVGGPGKSPASITAIDDTVPSITVDGGSWCAADGTRSDKHLGDTFVAGGPCDTDIRKVMSGSGSVFLGTNGAILLRENNKEWADNFYVTAPEQRIAARKVAAAAIKKKTK